MKWTTLLLSELNDNEIRILMKKYSTLDMVYANIDNFSENIKEKLSKCYNKKYYMKQLDENKVRIVSYHDLEYPTYLKQIYDFPPFIYLKGKKLNIVNSVGIVGANKNSILGKKSCEKIINELNYYDNICIISTLSQGISNISLNKSLNLDMKTILILATDIFSYYPKINKELQEKIEINGTVITEIRPNSKMQKRNLIMRSRLVAGLSRAIFIPQSYMVGEAMITSKFALEYNRDIYCTPADIFNSSFRGCNELITKNYAKLIRSADDIAYEYNWRRKSEEVFSNSRVAIKG